MKGFTKWRRVISLVLASSLLLSACNSDTTKEAGEESPTAGQVSPSVAPSSAPVQQYKEGTYTGIGKGKNGEVKVEVTFSKNKIESVVIQGENGETKGISDAALERIPAQIVDQQSLAIDSVAGASMTSNAILEAVAAAVQEAGGDVTQLKAAGHAEKSTAVEELTTDVVIIGAGAGGMTGAMEAARSGLKVIVLEKGASVAVSNGAMAGGPVAVGSRIQKEAGETFTVDDVFNRMMEYSSSTVNASLVRQALEISGETIDIFEGLGMAISLREDNFGVGYRPRMKFEKKGLDRMGLVQKDIEANGGQFLFETTGKQVLIENGKAVGVEAEKADGTKVTVHAKAVIMATGGYLGNDELMKEHFGGVKVNPLGSTLSVGEGMDMVVKAGGMLDNNFGIVANEFSGSNEASGPWKKDANQALNLGVYGTLLVNREGNRFNNEGLIAKEPLSTGGEITLREGLYYAVVDQAYIDGLKTKGVYQYIGSPASWIYGKKTLDGRKLENLDAGIEQAIAQGWGVKANTLEEAAAAFKLTNLNDTVQAYNEMAKKGVDSQFGKDKAFLQPIGKGPYYVFEYQPSAWCTIGGVRVDDHLRALDTNHAPIQGLYVAGVDAGSLYSNPYYDIEGAAFSLALNSGRLAAMNIAKDLK
ncbi:FAD-binding protein [Gorillibacterium sp. CAU 1737]|uniref:FAD-binding protein n=1 Tax=Gorillibacterium sp. CAU 1737 TaxID=3140362 RepID=UPI00326180CA